MASIAYPAPRARPPPRELYEPRYGDPAAMQIVAVDTDNARPCVVPGQAQILPSRLHQPHAASGGHGDIVERMRALKQLLEDDLITKSEYEDGKRKLLSRLLDGTERPPKPRSELAEEEAARIQTSKSRGRELAEYCKDLKAWGSIPNSEWKQLQRQGYPDQAVAQAVAKARALLQKCRSPPRKPSSASRSDVAGQIEIVPSPHTPQQPNKSDGRLVLIQQDRAAEWKRTASGAMASSGRRKQDTRKTLPIRKSAPAPRKATGKGQAVAGRASPSPKQAKRRLNLGTAGACGKNGTRAKGKAIRQWSEEEHTQFLAGFQRHGRGKWKAIARHVPSRTEKQVSVIRMY